MATLSPFAGWRYNPDKVEVEKVVAPPYDVIDSAQQQALYARDPHNCIRIILGIEHSDDSNTNNRYSRAAAHFTQWREEGTLYNDKSSIYLCEQEFVFAGKTHLRRGFICRVLLEEFGQGSVFPHERTLSGPKADRLKLMQAFRGNPEPVFGFLSDDNQALVSLLNRLVDWKATLSVNDDDDTATRFWVIDHDDKVHAVREAAAASQIFIADGHHRYETALNYRNEVRDAMQAAGQAPPPLGELDCDWILMMCVPITDQGLVIGPTHRLIHGIKGFDAEKLLTGCKEHFKVKKSSKKIIIDIISKSSGPPAFGLAIGKELYELTLKDDKIMDLRAADKPEPWRKLDVSVLHLLILEDLLGIDEEKLLRKENILYLRSAEESFSRAVENNEVQCAFLMRPTTMDQVRAVSHAGEVMPQKSTYFYPKILSGLVFNLFW
ncbi:MAG: DUF1015 domain-containing protein [Planctomycetes bacterium]|nr:DUF1015 domain-containing protein [Planctomycetota bacterium]